MNTADVWREVAIINSRKGDPEAAHLGEDDLWQKVLQAIADGSAEDPVGLAKAALTTADIEFERWYA